MTTKTMIEHLTPNGVNIKTQKYIEQDGVEYALGEPHRCAFVNSERGRTEIATELPEPYLSAVMAVWGDAPTVIENDGI